MTISEIAKLAGVSSATVSRYFNNGYLSEEKREAIAKVVKETGYRPSPQAQTLRTHRSGMVGVILPRIESTSIARVVAGISTVMNKNEYKIMLANTENNPDTELGYMKVFDNKQVDGVIFVATVITGKHKRMIRDSAIPIVVVGQKIDEADCVYHDDYHATYELTEMLINKGRKKPAYISALKEDRAVGRERTKGYVDAVRKHGLGDAADRIVEGDFSRESGQEAMEQLIRECPDIDAVISATDTMGVGAIQALRLFGKNIPSDVMIAGIGNSPMSEVISPTLTTMNYEYEESGRIAAQLLLDKILPGQSEDRASGSTPKDAHGAGKSSADGSDATCAQILLGHRLIERESTVGDGDKQFC